MDDEEVILEDLDLGVVIVQAYAYVLRPTLQVINNFIYLKENTMSSFSIAQPDTSIGDSSFACISQSIIPLVCGLRCFTLDANQNLTLSHVL